MELLEKFSWPTLGKVWVGLCAVAAVGLAGCDQKSLSQEEEIRLGRELYTTNCQSCHGLPVTGEDGIPEAPPHGPTGHTWHHADGQLSAIILGEFDYPGRIMPSFAGRLTEEEVAAILALFKLGWTEEQLAAQAEASRNWEKLQQPGN